MDQTDRYAIELRGIDKRFGEVYANKQINLQVQKGSIHGIVGENGAGKSTLMSIIYGFYHADKGEMLIDGNPFKPHGSQDAIAAGVGMVHQHFMLVNNFTVLENVILGAENGWHWARAWRRPRNCSASWPGTMVSRCRCTKKSRICRWACNSGSRSSRRSIAAPAS